MVISVVFGWTLFFYWWWLVLLKEEPLAFIELLLGITLCTLVFLFLTYAWIWHNTRQFTHGHRAAERAIEPPAYTLDALGRAVSLPRLLTMQDAAIVVVESTEDTKTFSAPHVVS